MGAQLPEATVQSLQELGLGPEQIDGLVTTIQRKIMDGNVNISEFAYVPQPKREDREG